MRTVITKKSLGAWWDERVVQACRIRAGIAEVVIEEIVVEPRPLDASGIPLNSAVEDLKAVFARIGDDAEVCVGALSEAEIMYRTLLRPFADRRKILETIGPEVETLLPAVDSRLLVDYVLTGKDAQGAHVVQALCTSINAVQEQVGVWKGAGLDPEIIDCPSAAVAAGARAMFDLSNAAEVVVVHMGWAETSVGVLSGAAIRFLGAVPYGFGRFMPARESGEGQGPAPDPTGTAGIEGGEMLAGLFREILIMLEKSGSEQGEQVLLATGYARCIRDFERAARDRMGMEPFTPVLKEIQYRGRMEELLQGFLGVSLACRGIEAQDQVNFRQGELGMTKRFRKAMGLAGPWVKAAVVLLVVWIAGLATDVFLKSRVDADLKKRINDEFVSVMPKGTPRVDTVRQMEQYLARLSGQAGMLKEGGGETPLAILKDLSAGIPADLDVTIDSINIEDASLTLSGSTGTYDQVERVQAVLAKLAYIKEVKIVSANVDKNDQKVKMKLVCRR
ncbi:MAG TPA: hypothetical protein PLR71_08625 [Deltaproteobacteria bacterium]|nr:hypothetical protein [Deltaproteobacteria bacterium]HQI81610.1 hypothetical protein [Deltaproteobacteria bacterium]